MVWFQLIKYFFVFTTPPELPAPPGTIILNDSMFIDTQMISKESYHEFLHFIHMSNGLLNINYRQCIPDSNIRYLGKPYLSSKRYKTDFPILNLNDYQITSFCKWRSWAVNLWKNNPKNRSCEGEYWELCDKADPLHLYDVIYLKPDSLVMNTTKIKKRINISELAGSTDLNSEAYCNKYFGSIKVYGIRCVAKYVLKN